MPSLILARTSIRPPSGVNLRALESRFNRTCFTFRSSPRIMPTRSNSVKFNIYIEPPKGDTIWMIQTNPANNVFRGSATRVR